jgi:hypothetical protein
VGRINVPNLLGEVSESIFQVNRGFFFTIKELFLRPGEMLHHYFDGKRQQHFKPIAYVLTLSTVYFLATKLTDQHTYLDDFIAGFNSAVTETKSGYELLDIVSWFAQNYAYGALLLLPVFSLASYLAFYGFAKNYLEHIVINSYMTGQQAVFYAAFAIGGKFVETKILELIPFVFSVSYAYWVFWQLFPKGSRLNNVFRSSLAYILYLLFNLAFFILLTFLVRW